MVKIWTIKEGWFIKWIKDVNEIKINEVISELNLSTGTPNPPGSQYIIGPSQLGKPNLVGIYFEQKKV